MLYYLVGVVVNVANHSVQPVWFRSAYGTNGCLLLEGLTSSENTARAAVEREVLAQVCHIFVCVFVLRVAAESGSSHPVVCEWVNV